VLLLGEVSLKVIVLGEFDGESSYLTP